MSGILKSLSAVRIFVDDLDRARHFYREILELPETATESGWPVFDLDGKDIVAEAVPADDPDHDLVGRFLAVSFDVDDVDATNRELKDRGVAFDHPPGKREWGGTLAFPRDPDGNTFTLVG